MMEEFLEEEKRYILEVYKKLLAVDSSKAMIKTGSKWSAKELIGHLIDSASNNHQRFVRAQFTEDLVFAGYSQDEWIKIQNYQSESWNGLINLWKEFNLHIIHLAANISPDSLTRLRPLHNLDKIAMQTVPANQPVTLEYFIRDYFFHLRHHLKQLEL